MLFEYPYDMAAGFLQSNQSKRLTQLSAFQQALTELQETTPDPASESSKALFEPGTEVLIKTLGSGVQSLKPLWESPHQVILSSPTAVKVPGIDS